MRFGANIIPGEVNFTLFSFWAVMGVGSEMRVFGLSRFGTLSLRCCPDCGHLVGFASLGFSLEEDYARLEC